MIGDEIYLEKINQDLIGKFTNGVKGASYTSEMNFPQKIIGVSQIPLSTWLRVSLSNNKSFKWNFSGEILTIDKKEIAR